ncbi:MAG: hypothetical protein OES09_13220, partial [Gammaproteobacteria bacterium]|nr:hypothetical protein [Gammaproteobacteria bacterium]
MLSISLGLAVALAVAELVLRPLGYPRTAAPYPNEPTMLEPHAIRGWRNKTGRYQYAAYDPAGRPITMTILSDGRRRSAENTSLRIGVPKIIIVGGSFVQGWAISDADTFAWKLQERFKDYQILNFGTAGYGTYQTLLLLEEILPKLSNVSLVIYGYYDHHDPRNVGTSDWLASLSRNRRRGHIQVPFAKLEGNRLRRFSPVQYKGLPLYDRSAFSALLDDVLIRIRDTDSLSNAAEVTH